MTHVTRFVTLDALGVPCECADAVGVRVECSCQWVSGVYEVKGVGMPYPAIGAAQLHRAAKAVVL